MYHCNLYIFNLSDAEYTYQNCTQYVGVFSKKGMSNEDGYKNLPVNMHISEMQIFRVHRAESIGKIENV
jgi:hypothetical protein